jgi:hypothetical protein
VGLRWIVFVRVTSPQNGPVHGSASPRRLSCVHVSKWIQEKGGPRLSSLLALSLTHKNCSRLIIPKRRHKKRKEISLPTKKPRPEAPASLHSLQGPETCRGQPRVRSSLRLAVQYMAELRFSLDRLGTLEAICTNTVVYWVLPDSEVTPWGTHSPTSGCTSVA